MHHPVDHVLALVLIVLFPLRAAFRGFKRLQHCPPDELPQMRRRVYREAIAIQWTLALGTIALWIALGRPWEALGLAPRVTTGLIVVAAIAAVLVGITLRVRGQTLEDDESLDELRDRMRPLEVLLPHSREEFRRFRWLAFTAGVCEELLYRGYLLWYLSVWMGLLPAAVASAVVFGIGHAYQGPRGMLQTGLFGALLVAATIASGSVYVAMILHGLMDLHAGHLMTHAYLRAEERRREAIAETNWLSEGGAPGPAPEPDPEGAVT